MAKGLSSAGRKALGRFTALVLAALALQGLYPLLFLMEGDAPVLLLVALTYGLLPIAALLLPCWAALGDVHPLAGCLPIGGMALLFGLSPAWVGLMGLVLSLIGAVGGQEGKKRGNKEAGKRHAGKARKRKKGC